MRNTIVSGLVAALALSSFAADASAQGRRHVVQTFGTDINAIPLTVNRRSWLDPGPVAPKGTGTNYVAASTEFNKTPDQVFAPDKFGNASLPGQPYVPGRSQPVVEFSTTPSGGVVVANELLPQNYYFNPAPSEP